MRLAIHREFINLPGIYVIWHGISGIAAPARKHGACIFVSLSTRSATQNGLQHISPLSAITFCMTRQGLWKFSLICATQHFRGSWPRFITMPDAGCCGRYSTEHYIIDASHRQGDGRLFLRRGSAFSISGGGGFYKMLHLILLALC